MLCFAIVMWLKLEEAMLDPTVAREIVAIVYSVADARTKTGHLSYQMLTGQLIV